MTFRYDAGRRKERWDSQDTKKPESGNRTLKIHELLGTDLQQERDI